MHACVQGIVADPTHARCVSEQASSPLPHGLQDPASSVKQCEAVLHTDRLTGQHGAKGTGLPEVPLRGNGGGGGGDHLGLPEVSRAAPYHPLAPRCSKVQRQKVFQAQYCARLEYLCNGWAHRRPKECGVCLVGTQHWRMRFECWLSYCSCTVIDTDSFNRQLSFYRLFFKAEADQSGCGGIACRCYYIYGVAGASSRTRQARGRDMERAEQALRASTRIFTSPSELVALLQAAFAMLSLLASRKSRPSGPWSQFSISISLGTQ